jgi:hypothetical protein
VPKTHKLFMNCQDSGNSFFPWLQGMKFKFLREQL